MRAKLRLAYGIIVSLISVVPAGRVSAVYSITNGGFDAQGPEVNNIPTVTPAGWFNESNAANSFSDSILNVQRGANGAISNLAGTGVGMWDANGLALGRNAPFGNDGTLETGYVYQQIGTYAGEGSLGVTGFVYNRTNNNQPGNFDVAFYYTAPGAFTPVVGTDIASVGSLIGTQQVFTQGVDFMITTGTVAQSAPWTHTESLAGIPNGSPIWLRIGDGGNPTLLAFDEPIIDNINIIGCGLGDVQCTGTVDANDLAAIRTNFRKTTGVTRAMGDLDGSGDVDMLDYLQWRRAVPPGSGALLSSSTHGVPEPNTVLLSLSAILVFYCVRRRRATASS